VVLIRCFALLVSAYLLIFSIQLNAAVVAEVDRLSIGFGETLQLIVRSDQKVVTSSPDTTGLVKDFDILSTSQSTRQSIINGRREISSEWLYTLAPKREGRLQIPPITLAGDITQPLFIEVGPASQASADAAVFLTSELDKADVYVQQQVILTLRVYHAVSLGRGANLSEPNITDAIIKKLTDNEFQTRIDGREYRVFEQKFAIFPQRSGSLEIPPSVLTATIPTRRNSRTLLDPFSNTGQTIRLMSEAMSLNVLPQDTRYQGEHWLPANDVKILEDWNGGATTLQLGDSATRTITVMAEGLLGAQIPPLPIPDIAGLKFYPDQPTVSDGEGDKIVGSFTQSYAIIATQPGSYTLPEQRLQWWDSANQKTRTAILPAQTLTVQASAETRPNGLLNQPSTPVVTIPDEVVEDEQAFNLERDPVAEQEDHLWWTALTILLLLWLASCYTTWYFWRKGRIAAEKQNLPRQKASSEVSLKALDSACAAGNAKAALQAFRLWALDHTRQTTLDRALIALGDDKLRTQIDTLQRGLFHPNATGDMSNALATIQTRVKHIHSKKKQHSKAPLAPLYPSKN
jgi:hypothetical protein